MKRILLVYDADGWAFHDLARRISSAEAPDGWSFQMANRARWLNMRPEEVARFDLVHFFWWHDYHLAVGRDLDLPATVSFHGEVGVTDKYLGDEAAARFQRARAVLSVTEKLALQLREMYGLTADLALEGVDSQEYRPSVRIEGPLVVGWAGRSKVSGYDDYKGVKLIAAAAERLGARVEIADREQRHRTQAEMVEWYRRINVYACASIAEGNPRPLQEAAACGIPFVSTDVGIASAWVRESGDFPVPCGVIVERSVDGIMAGLSAWTDPFIRLAAGVSARRIAVRYPWQKTADAYFAAWSSVLGPVTKKERHKNVAPTIGRKICIGYVQCRRQWTGPANADSARMKALRSAGAEVRLIARDECSKASLRYDLLVWGSPLDWLIDISREQALLKRPHAVTVHGFGLPGISPVGISSDVEKALSAAASVWTTSSAVARVIPFAASTVYNPIVSPPAAVIMSRNRSKHKTGKTVSCGSFCSLKGADLVIAWLRKYPGRRHDWLGHIGNSEWWDGRALAASGASSCKILGNRESVDVLLAIAGSTAVIHLSRMDSSPMVICEALSLNRPVICLADSGDAQQMIGGAGAVVSGDAEEIELALEQIEADPERISEAICEARQRLSQKTIGALLLAASVAAVDTFTPGVGLSPDEASMLAKTAFSSAAAPAPGVLEWFNTIPFAGRK